MRKENKVMAPMAPFLGILLWLISLAVFYFIIKTAVRVGVLEAHEELIESVRAIERKLSSTELRQ
jgi:hypothetical protein